METLLETRSPPLGTEKDGTENIEAKSRKYRVYSIFESFEDNAAQE